MIEGKPLFTMYVVYLPIALVWLIGVGLALIRWRRHPRVSLVTLLALGGFLLELMGHAGWTWLFGSYIRSRAHLIVRELNGWLAFPVLWALVVWAIFGWRGQSRE